MRARVLDHFAQLVDDRFRGRKVRVSHAEIDDIGAARSRARFQTVDLFENVRRQTPDFVKLFHLFPHGNAATTDRCSKFVPSPGSSRYELQNRQRRIHQTFSARQIFDGTPHRLRFIGKISSSATVGRLCVQIASEGKALIGDFGERVGAVLGGELAVFRNAALILGFRDGAGLALGAERGQLLLQARRPPRRSSERLRLSAARRSPGSRPDNAKGRFRSAPRPWSPFMTTAVGAARLRREGGLLSPAFACIRQAPWPRRAPISAMRVTFAMTRMPFFVMPEVPNPELLRLLNSSPPQSNSTSERLRNLFSRSVAMYNSI